MSHAIRRIARALALPAAFALAAPVTAIGAPAAAAVPDVRKVGMVDMQKVLNETKQGKAARKDLENSSAAKQKKLDKKRAELEKNQAELANLSGQALATAQEKLQRDYMEWQNMAMTLQQELAQQEAHLLEKIYVNSQGIVAGIAKEQGLDLVLVRDATTVIYAQDGLDITTELIGRYDKKFPK
jgi:outer membrane protein